MAFVGKRRCQATGGISCLQEMKRCGLSVDEKQGGTASILSPLGYPEGDFLFDLRNYIYK
jgi:hypothetical protein